jgi:hypothetical protein
LCAAEQRGTQIDKELYDLVASMVANNAPLEVSMIEAPMLTRAVFMKLLGTVALMIALRVLLTVGDAAVLCTNVTPWNRLVTLVFDFLTIAVIPPIVVGMGAQLSARTMLLVWLIALAGLALYELLTNPCLLPTIGR